MLDAYLSSICFLLAALNAFQLIYWSKQVQKLVDKLMSKDFNEYKTIENKQPEQRRPKMVQLPPDDVDNMAVMNQFM